MFSRNKPFQPWKIDYNDTCTEDDIYYLFRLILGRNPSEGEWNAHRQHLVGQILKNVVPNYVNSTEFKNRRLSKDFLSETNHELVKLDGFKMYVSPQDSAVGSGIHRNLNYEPHVTAMMKKCLKSDMGFIDIGANIGYFSLLAASIVGPNGKVISFEPYEYNIKLLYLNKLINNFEQMEIYPYAVADRQSLFAYDNVASNGNITEIDPNIDITHLLSTNLVRAVKLDNTLIDVNKIGVIKIDIEGAEYLALKGASKLLRKHKPKIFSEFSPPALKSISKVSPEDYLDLLLIDETYNISVLTQNEEIIDCGRDKNEVIKHFDKASIDHIDIMAYPEG